MIHHAVTKIQALLIVILAIGALAGGVYYYTVMTAPKESIKIGVIAELTGPWAYSGTRHVEGLKFAVEKINKAGGVLGRPIELVIVDCKSDVNEALTLFRRLVEVEGVPVVIGGISSATGVALAEEAQKLKVPFIVSWAAASAVHKKDYRYVFRANVQLTPPVIQGLVEYIISKGYNRVGLLLADYAFGRSVESYLKQYISQKAPGIQLSVEAAPVGESDFTAYLRKLKDFNPQIIVIAHPPGGATAIKQMIELGLTSPEVAVAYAPDYTELWNALKEDSFKVKLLHIWGSFDPTNTEYIKIAEEFYKEKGEFFDTAYVLGYIQVNLIAEAIKKAGSTNPEDIRNALSQIKFDSFLAFTISYTPWGELASQRIVITTIRPGPPPGNVNPNAAWHVEVVWISPSLEPYTPPE